MRAYRNVDKKQHGSPAIAYDVPECGTTITKCFTPRRMSLDSITHPAHLSRSGCAWVDKKQKRAKPSCSIVVSRCRWKDGRLNGSYRDNHQNIPRSWSLEVPVVLTEELLDACMQCCLNAPNTRNSSPVGDALNLTNRPTILHQPLCTVQISGNDITKALLREGC